jgi:hypothetical protein
MAPEAPRTPGQTRALALAGMILTIGLSVWSWQFLNRATTSGVERLARIDRVRALCTEAWGTARTEVDSMRVDRMSCPTPSTPALSRPSIAAAICVARACRIRCRMPARCPVTRCRAVCAEDMT